LRADDSHEFLGPAAGIVNPLLPLFAPNGGIRKLVRLLPETASRRRLQEATCPGGCDPKPPGREIKNHRPSLHVSQRYGETGATE